MTRRTVTLLAVALASGCTGARSSEAPIVVSVDRVGSGAISEGAPQQGTCTLYLKAEPIAKSRGGCFLDERVSMSIGVLTFPCAGDGPAYAVFDRDRYEGDVRGTRLALALETELDWSDSCHWITHHAIKGFLARGPGDEGGTLSWKYADNPSEASEDRDGNHNSVCSGSCTASTRLFMSAARPSEQRSERDGDEEMLHRRSP